MNFIEERLHLFSNEPLRYDAWYAFILRNNNVNIDSVFSLCRSIISELSIHEN